MTLRCEIWQSNKQPIYFCKEYQIEPKNGKHDPIQWHEYHKGNVDLIQNDDVFNSALVSGGSFGIVYSYHLELQVAYFVKSKRKLMPFDASKRKYYKKYFKKIDSTQGPTFRLKT